jgi:hypothetical protein
MPLEDLDALARRHIPDAKHTVIAPRNNVPSIRAQDEAPNLIRMPLEDSLAGRKRIIDFPGREPLEKFSAV